MRQLGLAGEAHRRSVYAADGGPELGVELGEVHALLETVSAISAETIRNSRRPDGLFHGYDLLGLDGETARIEHLEPMLEGQVAVLASGLLEDVEAVALLRAVRSSDLYRADQHSYLLYPDRPSVPFLERNTLAGPPPIDDPSLFVVDLEGAWHFEADLHTVGDLEARLQAIDAPEVVRRDTLDLWRSTFDHATFTGRSGRFFMFEGRGSIYWHMVAKLLLAVQESHQQAADPASTAALAASYHDIRDGLGFRKDPAVHGAFPTDPYSHTPAHLGAQQPGMTGQVKEQVLTRFGELGVEVRDGCIHIEPRLLPLAELHDGPLTFTYCHVPFLLRVGEDHAIEVVYRDGRRETMAGTRLDRATSAQVFSRRDQDLRVEVSVPASELYAGPARDDLEAPAR